MTPVRKELLGRKEDQYLLFTHSFGRSRTHTESVRFCWVGWKFEFRFECLVCVSLGLLSKLEPLKEFAFVGGRSRTHQQFWGLVKVVCWKIRFVIWQNFCKVSYQTTQKKV